MYKLKLCGFKVYKLCNFLTSNLGLGNKKNLNIVLLITGLAYTIDGLFRAIINTYTPLEQEQLILFKTWTNTWLLVLSLGLVNIIIVWNILGWWYNIRLKWCANTEINKTSGRIIYVYNRLIYSVPLIAITLIQSLIYENYIEAIHSQDIFSVVTKFIFLLSIIASIVNSYKSITAIFDLKRRLAQIWFLVLPLITTSILLVLIIKSII